MHLLIKIIHGFEAGNNLNIFEHVVLMCSEVI